MNPAAPRKYAVFISYRHSDNKEPGRQWATWLHQALETYEVPQDLVGGQNQRGEPVPSSLYPVFRDEEELPADSDLSTNIRRALENSSLLVVLCSPRAVQSRFVAEEIRLFKELGKSGRILALMIDGEPNASDAPAGQHAGNPELECLPEPLRFGVAREDGTIDWTARTEPIAADVRPGGRPVQGWTTGAAYREELSHVATPDPKARAHAAREYEQRLELAKLKVIAGALALPLGELTQRDKAYQLEKARQRARRARRLALAFVILGLLAVVGGVIAWTQRNVAKENERKAERNAAVATTNGQRANDALERLRGSAPSLLALAESEAAFQRFDSALVKLDAALALDPALTAGWWRRAWLLLGMARYGEAPAAFRTAAQRDPAQHAHDALLPVLDAIAAAPDDATRFPPERTEALFRHFTKVGASGELNALSQRLTLGAKQKEQMVRKRLDEWLGKGVGTIGVKPDGTIEVANLPKATDTLEPLHGLPIGRINLGGTAVKSLEPLRGTALTYLSIGNTRISDLSPLRGMPTTELHLDGSDNISDITPLAGMPLRRFTALGTKITDISPLRGAPLEEINLRTNRIVDFSPLRGAPLTKVLIGTNQCSDLSYLTDSPALVTLECDQNKIPDLTPLRGKRLKFLNAGGNRITDLRPLAGLPLTELNIYANPIADYAPLRELRQLEKLRISDLSQIKVTLEPLRQHPSLQYIALRDAGPYRPVAEFWADYDAQQAAGKK